MSGINGTSRSGLAVTITESKGHRSSPRTDFGAKLGNVLDQAGKMVTVGGAMLSPIVPGAGLVSAAVAGVRNLAQVAGEAGGDGTDKVLDNLDQGSDSLFEQSKKLQEMNHAMNLEYLQLQQQVQQEQRRFSTLSELMSARHQAAMRAIQNMGR